MDYCYGPGRDLLVDGCIVLHGMVGGSFWDEGFTASDVVHSLAALGPTADVTVRINSSGGIAHEGLAIHAVLSAHKGRVTTVVEGLAASAASIIAQAGDERVMAAGAMMMVHDAAVWTEGNASEHQKSLAYLEVVCASLAAIYADATERPVEEIRSEMAAETWLTAEDAVAKGYADRIGAASDDEPAPFPFRAYAKAPQRLVAMADARGWSKRPLPNTATASAAAVPQPGNKETPMPSTNDPAAGAPAAPATQPAAAQSAPATATPQATNVVSIDDARAAGRADALSYVREINEICTLAGRPELATAFIEKDAKPSDVRKELIDARASASAASTVATQTLAGTGAATAAGYVPGGLAERMKRAHAKKGA
ncbi:head maturation protease, ClpP-related [Methylobacterium nigriterrae]|uniref:head maturation protease, ClpP-related n=1 Tax=Methylobacterium nigriterrae TaxID=3127512 RepID=UPI003013D4D0